MLPFLSEMSGWMRLHQNGGKHCYGEPGKKNFVAATEEGEGVGSQRAVSCRINICRDGL